MPCHAAQIRSALHLQPSHLQTDVVLVCFLTCNCSYAYITNDGSFHVRVVKTPAGQQMAFRVSEHHMGVQGLKHHMGMQGLKHHMGCVNVVSCISTPFLPSAHNAWITYTTVVAAVQLMCRCRGHSLMSSLLLKLLGVHAYWTLFRLLLVSDFRLSSYTSQGNDS